MSDAPSNPSDMNPADLAADALRQAQDAVSDLRRNTDPVTAASGGDEAAAAALRSAQEAIAAAKAENGPVSGESGGGGQTYGGSTNAPSGQAFKLPSFGAPGVQKVPEGIDLLSDVNLNVKIELGRTRMLVEDVLRLGEGSVVELDKLAGDPVDVYVNDRHVARGEVLVLNDNFCVRINEIVAAVGDHPAAVKRR
jgi:flagellar motor switch protein FliN